MRNIGGIEREYRRGRRAVSIRATPGTEKDDYSVVVTGPRQVGKTTMLKHLMDEDAENGAERAYVTLDNTAILQTAKEDPALFLQRYRPPVLIDEIQKAPELLPYIKELVDSSDRMGMVWLTGSQPFHLMKEVSESLTGRVCVWSSPSF